MNHSLFSKASVWAVLNEIMAGASISASQRIFLGETVDIDPGWFDQDFVVNL